jgi:hypothetical protein
LIARYSRSYSPELERLFLRLYTFPLRRVGTRKQIFNLIYFHRCLLKYIQIKQLLAKVENDNINTQFYADMDRVNELTDRENELKSKDNLTSEEVKELESIQIEYDLHANSYTEGGETTLYYLRLLYRGRKYYKIGVTLRDISSRYTQQDQQYIEKVLYEKKLTHANTIEQKILKDFHNHIFPLAILSSGHSEVFDYDILELDE